MEAVQTMRIAIVGGGITGLAAAWELSCRLADAAGLVGPAHIVVLEGGACVGGKLRSAEIAGHQIDVGAESVLARRPEALELIAEAGLTDGVVHPTPAPASIWSRGRRWPLPPRTLMGVPSDPDSALGILTAPEVARLRSEPTTPTLTEDVSVGDFVESRVGAAVVDRLVEPLLAGVYAGHARRLSLRATVPELWAAARTGAGIVDTAAEVARRGDNTGSGPSGARPVFAGYRGGLGHLAADLSRRLQANGIEVRTGVTVRRLERTPDGWALALGPTTAPERLEVDAVVLAAPAAPTGRLLVEVAPQASQRLQSIDYASMAIVTLALPRSGLRTGPAGTDGVDLSGSGFLVPPTEPVTIKAATFSASKWQWLDDLDPEIVHLRASVGRQGETATLQREDADLVAVALADLGTVLGSALPRPVDAHVQRWGGGLPQYAVGHVDRVASIMADVAGLAGLELAGAAYEGVGVPACIASARRAARSVATHLLTRRRDLP